MWNDLSILDKSRIMLLAVLNGITSLSKIQLLYDSSVNKSDDYDYAGYYLKYPNDLFTHLEGQHYTDEFKLPSHPTFSNESIYSNRQTPGGNWSRISNNNGLLWNFTPSDWQLHLKGYLPKVIDYLIDAESLGVTLTDKYGRNHKINGDLWGGVLPEIEVTPYPTDYAKGGKIHIKPENRGKFTALKERTGYSATWFKQHGTPALKKMATFALNAKKWKHDDGGYINRYDDGGQLKENLIKAASKILNPIGSKHDSFWHTVDILGAPSHVTNAIRDVGNRLASYPAIIADAVYNHYANNLNWTEALQEAETNPSTLASLFQVHPIENNENNYSLEELALMYELTRPRKGKKEGGINAQDYRNINSKNGEGNKYAATITRDNFFDPNKVIEWSVGGMSGLTDESGLPISFDRFAYDVADTYGVYGNPNTWNNPVKPLRFAVGIIGSKGYPNRKDSKTSIVTKVPVAALKAAYDKLNNQYGLGSLLANDTRVIKNLMGNIFGDGGITSYSNYLDAKDSPSNMIERTNLAIRMGLRKLLDKGLNPFGSGISNCTLSATQWIDPNNPVMHSVNIINNPAKYGYIPITPEDTIAGDLIISATPKRDSFHSMYIEGFDNNDLPIVRYSRGSGNPEDIVRGITLDEYNTRDKGKHSETLYYRYAQNGYPLSELLVTPNGKSTGGPLYPFSFSKIPYIKTPIVRY